MNDNDECVSVGEEDHAGSNAPSHAHHIKENGESGCESVRLNAVTRIGGFGDGVDWSFSDEAEPSEFMKRDGAGGNRGRVRAALESDGRGRYGGVNADSDAMSRWMVSGTDDTLVDPFLRSNTDDWAAMDTFRTNSPPIILSRTDSPQLSRSPLPPHLNVNAVVVGGSDDEDDDVNVAVC